MAPSSYVQWPQPSSSYLRASLRYLPSFPTRRSSDLASRIPHPGFSQHEVHESFGLRSGNQSPRVELQLERAEDRKSTRLNSSHTVISYAVFCLKKKKEKTQASIAGIRPTTGANRKET